MTDLAFGAKCGLPSGARVAGSARATPSRNSMAPSARPVKPMPVSARNERRVTPGQQCGSCRHVMVLLIAGRVAQYVERSGRVSGQSHSAEPEAGHAWLAACLRDAPRGTCPCDPAEASDLRCLVDDPVFGRQRSYERVSSRSPVRRCQAKRSRREVRRPSRTSFDEMKLPSDKPMSGSGPFRRRGDKRRANRIPSQIANSTKT